MLRGMASRRGGRKCRRVIGIPARAANLLGMQTTERRPSARKMRLVARVAAGAAGLVALAALLDAATYDARAWRADFETLKLDMAQHYANLDWIAEHRGVDAPALARRTESEIDTAYSRVRAYLAVRRFVGAFADPHLRLEGREAPSAGAPAGAGASAAPRQETADCGSAGYEEGDHGFAFPFERISGWRPISGGSFPTGAIGRTGVLRIAELGENRYLAACRARFRVGLTARELQLAVRAGLQAELKARLDQLRRAGAERVIVDLTGNGGGSEWVGEVVSLFTARELSREAPRLASPDCDRSDVWRSRPACPVLAPAGEAARIRGQGAWTGPVLILANRGTASAAEDFVAWLKGSGVARLAGERTAGAGCGYVNGGHVTRFAAAPVQVKMPNCARFLPDGRNEIEGIAPDVALPMDRPEEAATALAGLIGP